MPTPSASAIRYSRLADTRSVPFSYFCTCWKGDGTDLPGEIALTEAELYAAQFDASAYVDVEPCRKGFVIVLSFRHFRCSLDAKKNEERFLNEAEAAAANDAWQQ